MAFSEVIENPCSSSVNFHVELLTIRNLSSSFNDSLIFGGPFVLIDTIASMLCFSVIVIIVCLF